MIYIGHPNTLEDVLFPATEMTCSKITRQVSAEVTVESETSVSFYSIICSSDRHIVMTEINLQRLVKGQVQNFQA